MARTNPLPDMFTCYCIIGTAVKDFVYGGPVLLRLNFENHSISGFNSSSFLANDDTSSIQAGTYKFSNTITLNVPRYMADEQYCGCPKCNPNMKGKAGQQFLVTSIQGKNTDVNNLVITARL